MNAVTYYRYSSHNQTEKSIEGQRVKAEEFANKNGYVILREYVDRAQTGKSDVRTNFQRLISDSKKETLIM